MNIFKDSTQYKNWFFKSQSDIDHAQFQKFEKGLSILAKLSNDLQSQEHTSAKVDNSLQTNRPQHTRVNLKSK